MTGTEAGRADPDADALDARRPRPPGSRPARRGRPLSEDDAATVNVETQSRRPGVAARRLPRPRPRAQRAGGAAAGRDDDARRATPSRSRHGCGRPTDATVLAIANLSDEPVVGVRAVARPAGRCAGRLAATLLGTVGGDPAAARRGAGRHADGGVDGVDADRGARPAERLLSSSWRRPVSRSSERGRPGAAGRRSAPRSGRRGPHSWSWRRRCSSSSRRSSSPSLSLRGARHLSGSDDPDALAGRPVRDARAR